MAIAKAGKNVKAYLRRDICGAIRGYYVHIFESMESKNQFNPG